MKKPLDIKKLLPSEYIVGLLATNRGAERMDRTQTRNMGGFSTLPVAMV